MALKAEKQMRSSREIKRQLGQLPDCWPDSAIFLANLDCIFFGDPLKTGELLANVKGFRGYGARLLPILGLLFRGGENLLLLGEQPNTDLIAFFRDTLGLLVPEVAVLALPPGCGIGRVDIDPLTEGKLRASRAAVLDGYVTDRHLEELAGSLNKRNINSIKSCQLANDKIALNRFLATAGLPQFDGGDVGQGGELRQELEKLAGLGYDRAVVRAALGASGFGMQILDLLKEAAAERLSPVLRAEERLLVQGWVEDGRRGCSGLASPSVQFFCGPGERVCLYDFTDQLLSNKSVHEGNMAPPLSLAGEREIREEVLRQAALVADWVSTSGYRGPGSVDFLVWREGDKAKVQVCEVNARVTGATYPSLLALHCNPGGAWLMRNMIFGPCMNVRQFLRFLAEKEILFDRQRGRGIIPVNVICAENGQIVKCQLLFLSDTTQNCLKLMEQFPTMLPSYCLFERD